MSKKEKREWAKKKQIFECGTCGTKITIVPKDMFPLLEGDATEFIGSCGKCGYQTYFYFKDFSDSNSPDYKLV